MSALFYMGAEMSFQEKRAWIYAVVNVGVPAVYFAIILGKVPGRDVATIAYAWPMIWSIIIAMVLNTAANTAAATASPKDARKKDERDKQIGRLGEDRKSTRLNSSHLG